MAGVVLAAGMAAGGFVWVRDAQEKRARAEEEARLQREKAAREAEEDGPRKNYRQVVGEMSM
jgi:hypothetical protein